MYTLKYNLTLLVNGYLQNASEKNINECFQLLKTTKEANINWNDSNEINELIEQQF